MKCYIFGVGFDTYTPDEAVNKAASLLSGDKKGAIFTPNPEFLLMARKDREFLDILNRATMLVPDGVGVVMASRILKTKPRITERVAGGDLLMSMLGYMSGTGQTAYFLGAGDGVAESAKENMEKRFPGLKIVGVHNGYFDEAMERNIIDEINALKPDLLAVGLGVGRQEKWIARNIKKLNCKVFIACGGFIDVMGGKVKRAPAIFRKLGIEWLYRLFKEPKRIKRQLFIPVFVALVIKERFSKKKQEGSYGRG